MILFFFLVNMSVQMEEPAFIIEFMISHINIHGNLVQDVNPQVVRFYGLLISKLPRACLIFVLSIDPLRKFLEGSSWTSLYRCLYLYAQRNPHVYKTFVCMVIDNA